MIFFLQPRKNVKIENSLIDMKYNFRVKKSFSIKKNLFYFYFKYFKRVPPYDFFFARPRQNFKI
jgi:hypothetical protein